MILSKNVNNKKCATKLVFFNEKKMRKIRIVDIENWLWKSNFGTFWQFAVNPKLKTQNSIISFEYVDSFAKIFPILYPPLTNLTTCITITPVRQPFDLLNFFQPVITWQQQTIRNFKAVMSLVEKSVEGQNFIWATEGT